ncbi:hypothetical protein [Microvirga solisilvae]|uniref:hypothetical protein n=1 Tax=Microvirga solisilvae TaxID=2919498 RepID=UPI001FAF8C0D|nr:hypothetical protein [Microvirga solisilvae]
MRLTFQQMALELRRAAELEASSLDALELFALRDDTGLTARTMRDVKERCARLVQMSEMMNDLAPHEITVRAMIARGGQPA